METNNAIWNGLTNRRSEFSNRGFTTYSPTDTLWSALANNSNEYIKATFETYLRRPDLFEGKTSLNLLYALYIGNTNGKETLMNIFENYIQSSPSKNKTPTILLWANEIREKGITLAYEPVLSKLNKVMNSWVNSGSYIEWNGKKYNIDTFRPILYNSEGVLLVDLIPYIAYLFTYVIYGFPYQFSEEYSESSMKAYLSLLEEWFGICYQSLYKEQGTKNDISDVVWKGFYSNMLNERKIVEIRNEELNRTEDLLTIETNTQLSIVDEDLASKYELVVRDLIKAALHQVPWMKVFDVISNQDGRDILNTNTKHLMYVSEWISCGANPDYFIDEHDNYRITHYENGSNTLLISNSLPKLIVNEDSYCFARGDVKTDILFGYINERYQSKITQLFDDDPIHIGDEVPDIYGQLCSFFCNGIWMSESKVISSLDIMSSESFIDFLHLHDLMRILFEKSIATEITPIYFLSFLNQWLYAHISKDRPMNDFNVFKYMRWSVENINDKLLNELIHYYYSFVIIENESYRRFFRNEVSRYMELIQSSNGIYQPYVKTMDDEVEKWALSGIDGYKFARIPNPIVRGYGFVSSVFGIDEQTYLIYRMCEMAENDSLFKLIRSDMNWDTIQSTLKMIIDSIPEDKLPRILTRIGKTTSSIIEECKNEINRLITYTFSQSLPSLTVDESIKVKSIDKPNERATTNSYLFGEQLIPCSITTMNGKVYRIPIYSIVGTMEDTLLRTVVPNGLRIVEVITLNENSTYWILSPMNPPSQFTPRAIPSNEMPNDGAYMLTDRIQSTVPPV